MAENKYRSGICNIGPEEIARRRNFGWITLAVTISLLFVLVRTGVNPLWRLFIFFPAMMSASGFLQAYFHFCSGFAQRGIFNFDSIGQSKVIADESSKIKDRKRGNQITLYAVLIAITAAIISVIFV